MNEWLVVARAVHYASAMLLFGELLFVFVVAGRPWREPGRDIQHWVRVVAWWSIGASIVSGTAWLAAQASLMSGMPVDQALNRETLARVLGDTLFGRVWALRFGLVVALGALLLAMERPASDRARTHFAIGAIVVAAAHLATLALAGHAAGQQSDRIAAIASDGLHLLAAGAWVGALPGLVYLLGSEQPLDAAASAARRFSALAIGSVCVLVASGLVSAWYLVGDVPALFGTNYGRLLLAKLALFAAMATLGMVNRWYVIPRLARDDAGALRSLRRNAVIETAMGIAVVAIVGALGITIPAAHETPLWPFDYTLSWQAAEQSPSLGAVLGAAAMIAGAAVCGVLGGLRGHQPRYWLAGLAGIAAAALTWAWLLAVPAFPTTYAASPVPYATDSIVRGAAVHAQNCSKCHGEKAMRIDYAAYPYPGNLFWSIAHGVAGTPMPGFSPRLPDADIWALIQFLRVQSEARRAMALTDRVDPWRGIVAPDFTFEAAGQPQESLRAPPGPQLKQSAALVVLYSLPASQARLSALTAQEATFAKAGVRVVFAPLEVAAVYALFAQQGNDAVLDAPAHVEFLVDRYGYLRARWIGIPDPATDRTADIQGQIEVLNREPEGGPAARGSGH